MIGKIKRYFWKRNYLKKLEGDAFVKEAMSLYSLTTIDDLNFLKGKDEEEKVRIEKEIESLQTLLTQVKTGSKEDYDTRQNVKDLKKEIEKIDVRILGRTRAIDNVTRQAADLKHEAFELQHRRDIFAKKFKP